MSLSFCRSFAPLILFVVFWLQPLTAAEEKETSGEAKVPSASQSRFPYAKQAALNPNICPVCGKSWNMTTGKDNPHVDCFKATEPEKEIVNCPSCALQLEVNRWIVPPRTEAMDRDLCPHPPGEARTLSELIICPRCGLSTTKDRFKSDQSLSHEERMWISKELTPRTQKHLLSLIGLNIEQLGIAPDSIYKQFKEEQVPDELRGENAFLYARQFQPTLVAKQARLAMLTAWAYRRRVSEPLVGSFLMSRVDALNKKLEKTTSGIDLEPEKRVAILVEEYKKNDLYTLLERQILLIMMAGDYQRLGYQAWSSQCLKTAYASLSDTKQWAEGERVATGEEGKAGSELNSNQFLQLRQSLATRCQLRLTASQLEMDSLKLASDLTRESLKQNVYSPKTIPAYVYLVGEFERRLGNLPRATRWLEAASKMQLPVAEQGVEIWAEDQLKQIPNTKEVYPEQREDSVLLLKLSNSLQPGEQPVKQ